MTRQRTIAVGLILTGFALLARDAAAADGQRPKNVAADPACAETRVAVAQQLLDELRRTAAPRLVRDGRFFETPSIAGPVRDGSPAARKEG